MFVLRSVGTRLRRSVAAEPEGILVVRFFRSCVLFVAATGSLTAGGSLALSGVAPAGASPVGITVHCPADNLQTAINAAPTGSTLLVDGTCTGNFYIGKNLTLSGPAILDGGGIETTFGATLNVAAGTVVLNHLVIQNGVGIDGLGGGVWNGGQLTLNHSTVTNNTANDVGGVFNFGQLTLNSSTVSHNTATNGDGGGISNCAASLHDYGLCTGAPGSLTLNQSIVSNNVASGDGGGILNDGQAVMTLNGSIVSGNTAGHSGGGIENNGTATLNVSAVSNNSSTGGSAGWSGGGGLSSTGRTTLNYSIVRANSAAWLGGGIFAGGPMTINKSIVTGNSAGPAGGGMVAWDGLTTVTNSVFWHNSDQGVLPDNPAGVWVAPSNFGGFFTNNPTFTTTRSWYS
jgi:hypothetical protein